VTTARVWYSYDAGNKWWKGDNLPISQFYHVSLDNDRPYHVYGGLQDNSSWVGDSEYPGGITNSRWENMYGGDGFWMFVDPTDPNYLYAEAQGGEIGRVNRKTQRDASAEAASSIQGRKAALQLEHADPHEPDAKRHGVHRLRSTCIARRISARHGTASHPISRPTIPRSSSRSSRAV